MHLLLTLTEKQQIINSSGVSGIWFSVIVMIMHRTFQIKDVF